MKTSNVELENELFKSVYDKTPDYIKNLYIYIKKRTFKTLR